MNNILRLAPGLKKCTAWSRELHPGKNHTYIISLFRRFVWSTLTGGDGRRNETDRETPKTLLGDTINGKNGKSQHHVETVGNRVQLT
ncbi:hypothetical protein GWI33_012679 [Rhynchophorus ferrugineus]|uniref:Uncharacterized protein n=1 Tax=Rhynchophorus ferrugineus TaxID=354439 RepID=A0A834II97_RHYFE|nr:hypothetical protein GWI33_012679 [Rhynchophorus ferrugineus]